MNDLHFRYMAFNQYSALIDSFIKYYLAISKD
jgi:hypothetical protein